MDGESSQVAYLLHPRLSLPWAHFPQGTLLPDTEFLIHFISFPTLGLGETLGGLSTGHRNL